MAVPRSSWRARILAALWIALLLAVFLLPYAQVGWWSFQASTAALLAGFALRWRRAALRRAGLPVTARAVLATVAFGLGLYALFRVVVAPAVSEGQGLVLAPYPVSIAASFVFQTLNEEIVLGFLLVVGLARKTRRPVLVALGVAVVFSLLHLVLYRYGTLGMDLHPVTLVALVAVGVIRNSAILLAGHVGIAWGLHAAWNLVMFAGRWHEASSGRVLKEPEILDAFLGPLWIVLPAVLMAVVLLLALRARPARGPAHA